MKYEPKFFKILIWEALENAPMLIGFLLAARIQAQNLILAFVVLLIGTATGAGLIHFTESKKYSNQPSLKETLVNFTVFTFMAIPFVFYFSAKDVWWSNWATDIILGVLAGCILSFGESWGWSSTATVKMHSISMAMALALFLYGFRLTFQLEPLIAIVLVGVVFNFFVSAIIVRFDYWPIKESQQAIAAVTETQFTKNVRL